jgi:hypothetical protein
MVGWRAFWGQLENYDERPWPETRDMYVIARNLELDAQGVGHVKGAGTVASVKPRAIGLRCHGGCTAAHRMVQGMSREVFHHRVC